MGFYELIKSCDVFGANINFYIKSERNYTSFWGGLVFLLYSTLCPIYIIICLISFINRNNISVIHYSKELFATEELSFANEETAFAVGLQCDDYNNTYGKLEDLFDLEFNYIHRVKLNGTMQKEKLKLPLHICTYDDFHEDLRNDLDVNKITTDYYCPNERNHSIKGIITDSEFSFYELILQTKKDLYYESYLNVVNKYDCKFNLFFSDVSIDVTNVTHPIQYYLNNVFIQLASVFFKKVDTYFNIKSFKDDENLFFNSPEKSKYLTFSRTELYDIYMGENRYETKFQDYKKYAKYFIKADKTKTIIERKCEKFSEMVASTASILSGILLFIRLVTEFLNYSFAMKNILDTLLNERKEFTKKMIKIKNKLPDQQSNDIQNNKSNKKIDDSKIKLNSVSLTTTIEELRNNLESKISNNNTHNNYNINNFYIGLKKNNFINFNSDVNTVDGMNLDTKINDKIKQTNLRKLSVKKNSLIETKSDKNNNDLTELSEVNLKTKNELIIINNIIKNSMIQFYLYNLFSPCKRIKKNNYEIYLKKSIEQLSLRLDVINYLKIVDRLEILFHILFKSSDLSLFTIISKFNLNKMTNNGKLYYNNDYYSERLNLSKFLNNYIQLSNNKEKNMIEERLQKLIQKEMSEL